MKRKINVLLLIVVFIYLGFYVNAVVVNIKEYNFSVNSYKITMNNCSNHIDKVCKSDDASCIDFCKNFVNNANEPKRYDFVRTFFDLFYQSENLILQNISPLLIGVVAVWPFICDLKSGNIKNKLTRINYKKYMIKNWLSSLKYTLIIPVFIALLFVSALILSRGVGTQNISESFKFFTKYNVNLFVFIPTWLLCFIFQGIFWINLFFICAKRSKNSIISIIVSYLTYFGCGLVSEVVFGILIPALFFKVSFKNPMISNYFSFYTIWAYDVKYYLLIFLYQILLCLISTLLLYKTYKNKEEVLVLNEI